MGLFDFIKKAVKGYEFNEDAKYYSIQSVVESELLYFPEEFIMRNDLGMPASLKQYQI